MTDQLPVNDIFDELSNENKRLLNELIFANKCLKALFKYKSFVDSVLNMHKIDFHKDFLDRFQSLQKDVDNAYNRIDGLTITENPIAITNYSSQLVEVIESDPIGTCDVSKESPLNGLDSKTMTSLKYSLVKFKDLHDLAYKTNRGHFNQNILNRFQELIKEVQNIFNKNINRKSVPVSTVSYNKSSQVLKETPEVHFEVGIQSEIEVQSNKFEEQKKPIDKPFSCSITGCKFRTKTKRCLNQHFRNRHKSQTKFKCNACEESFMSEKSLNIHQKIAHNIRVGVYDPTTKEYICDFIGCGFRTVAETNLIGHKNIHFGLKPYKCSECDVSYTDKSNLNRHIRTKHKNIFKHICDVKGCDFKTHKRHQMINHKNIEHKKIRPFECSKCQSKYGCEVSLRIHEKKHSSATFKCQYPGCKKIFSIERYLKHHYKRIHLNIRRENRFHCNQPDCNYSCEAESNLLLHKYKHTNVRPYICTVNGCGKAFKNEYHLKSHKNLHYYNSEQVFQCEQCLKKYTNRRSFNCHKKIAHSNRVYRCEWPGCEYQSKSSASVKRHTKLVHTSRKEYACDWPDCHKMFKTNQYLKRHLSIHNNDKRYACSWPGCEYRCVSSSNMIKHKRIHEK